MMMNGKKNRNPRGAIFLFCALCSAFSMASFAEQGNSAQGSSVQAVFQQADSQQAQQSNSQPQDSADAKTELQKNLSSGSIYDESTAVMLNSSEASDNKTDLFNEEAGVFSERKTISDRKTADQPALKTDSGRHLVSVFMGLAVIIGLILALAWIVRRFSQGGIFTQSSIKIVAALPMGTRERLVVVDVAGQQILLGVTATQINKLHVFDEPVIDVSQPAAHSEFGKKLFSVMQQKATNNASTPKE